MQPSIGKEKTMQANRGQPREGNEDREKCSRLRRVQAASQDGYGPDCLHPISRVPATAPGLVRDEHKNMLNLEEMQDMQENLQKFRYVVYFPRQNVNDTGRIMQDAIHK